MLNTIIIIAAILILVILFAIFRVSSLVDVIKGDSSTKIPSSNGTQANLLLLFLIVGLVGWFLLFLWRIRRRFCATSGF